MSQPTVVWMPGSLKVEVLLRAQDTGGAFCMLADHPQPGWGLPPHSYAAMEDFFLGAGSAEAGVSPDLGRLLELAGEHGWAFEQQ